MQMHRQSWWFWFWPAFLTSAFTVLNVVGFTLKGVRYFGFPFHFAKLWSDGGGLEFIDGYALLMDFCIGLAVYYYAWAFAAWRFAKPMESSPPATPDNPGQPLDPEPMAKG